jgi:lipopolysaccharide export system protein LptA
MTGAVAKITRCAAALAVLVVAAALRPGASAAQEAAPEAAPAIGTETATAAAPPYAAAATAAGTEGGAGTTEGPAGSFAGLSKNSNEPIDIESDLLYVYDAKKYATFKGDVKAVQGTTTIRSSELDVHYVGSGSDSLTGAPKDAASAGKAADAKKTEGVGLGGAGTKISKIYARGNVVISSDQDQTTTSDWALYDVPAQRVTVGGNVVLTQGNNVLKGDRLIIDLTTGESRFENTGSAGSGKRIRALFMPKEKSGSKDAKSDDGQSGKKKAETDPPAAGPKASGQAAAVQGGAARDETLPWQILPGSQQ